MENISLGQIATIITFASIFIGAITTLIAFSKSFISKVLNPINQKIDRLEKVSMKSRNNIELELIKIILVTQIQKKNIYELYDRYKTLGGNSYVHDRWEKLIKEGKL